MGHVVVRSGRYGSRGAWTEPLRARPLLGRRQLLQMRAQMRIRADVLVRLGVLLLELLALGSNLFSVS